ncbi:acyltransferase family protein [Ferruginibacter sp.]
MIDTQHKNLQLIQMLRGIASLLVVLLHITINYSENLPGAFLFNIFKFGGSGVDIFFVLSGFIITYSSAGNIAKSGAFLTFIKRRIIRIFPIYWITISIFLLIQIIFFSFYKTHFDLTFTNICSTYLLFPNHIMINGVSWSLTNELFFYLLFSVAVLIPYKKITLYLMVAYSLVLIVSGVLNLFDLASMNSFVALLLFPMNMEFFLGVLVALIVHRFPSKWIYPFLITGLLLFLAGAANMGYFSGMTKNGTERVLFFGVPSFLVILSLVKWELTKKVNIAKIFVDLGNASYSIYLIHLPVVAAFYKVVVRLNFSSTFILQTLSLALLIIVSILGIVVYKKVEKPLIKKLNSFFR